MNRSYCSECRQYVKPEKRFSWLAFILLLGIFYLPYYWFIKTPQCPHCGSGFGAMGKDRVKVVNNFSDAAPGEVFRLKDDNPNVLRFQPERPEDYTPYGKAIGSGEPVAGTSHREETVRAFIEGRNRSLEVEYAPTEKFPEAIKVFGVWDDVKGTHRQHIGYVNAETAKEIHEKYKDLPIATELRTIYKPTQKKSPGIRMFLLRAKYPGRFEK